MHYRRRRFIPAAVVARGTASRAWGHFEERGAGGVDRACSAVCLSHTASPRERAPAACRMCFFSPPPPCVGCERVKEAAPLWPATAPTRLWRRASLRRERGGEARRRARCAAQRARRMLQRPETAALSPRRGAKVRSARMDHAAVLVPGRSARSLVAACFSTTTTTTTTTLPHAAHLLCRVYRRLRRRRRRSSQGRAPLARRLCAAPLARARRRQPRLAEDVPYIQVRLPSPSAPSRLHLLLRLL
jgi:hypothetical protein